MLIYRSPKTGAWMMTRDGVNYFEWTGEDWQPHQSNQSTAADEPAGQFAAVNDNVEAAR